MQHLFCAIKWQFSFWTISVKKFIQIRPVGPKEISLVILLPHSLLDQWSLSWLYLQISSHFHFHLIPIRNLIRNFSQFFISLFTQAKSNCYFILSLRAQQTFIVFVRSSFVLISFNSFHFVSMSCGKFVCLIIAATAVSIYNLFVDVWGVRWALSSGNDKQQQPTAPEARVLYSDLNDDVDGADGDRDEHTIGMPALTHVLLYWHDYQLFYFSLYLSSSLPPTLSFSRSQLSFANFPYTRAHTHLPPLSVSPPRSHFKLKFSSLEVSN